MPFRLQARHIFLTYPKCDADPNALLAAVRQRLGVKHYSIGRERHADGDLHLHGYFELERKCDLRGPECLDFDGFHGDYAACRQHSASIKYTQKDGDFITDIVDIRQRIRETTTQREFMDLLVDERKVHQYRFWSDYRTAREKDPPIPDIQPRPWFSSADGFEHHQKGKRPRALYLWGPPQTGKTTYVISRHPSAFSCSTPKEFSTWFNESVFFFDDFDYDNWKYDISFLNALITTPRSVKTPAYYGVKVIPWPRTVYFASNQDVGLFWQEGFKDRLFPFLCT